jgi:hypothetical protein
MRTLRRDQPTPHAMSARVTTFDAVPSSHGSQATSEGAPLALRLRVFVMREKLDRQIAAGSPCGSSAALSLRARQLTDPRTRQQIARKLRGMVDYVYRVRSRTVLSAVLVEPAAVRGGRSVILGLAERLEGTAPLTPRGVVLARALLTDSLSPLFNPYSERTVAQAVGEVEDALGGHPTIGFDAVAA